jgi:transcriptional regulator with XRE-family HTH domain
MPRPKIQTVRSTLSSAIRDAIIRRNLSANAVAVAAGIPATTVSRFVGFKRSLSLESAEAIATALGLDLVETRGGLR